MSSLTLVASCHQKVAKAGESFAANWHFKKVGGSDSA